MKKTIVLILLVLLISCSKSIIEVPITAEIQLGIIEDRILGRIVAEGFVPFENQDTIRLGELSNSDVIGITIIEKNVDSSYFLGTERKPTFNFRVTTSRDDELFISDQNCFLSGYGGGGDNINDIHYLQGSVEIPITISAQAKKNNDILEFNNDNDYIVISYLSKYSKVFIRDSTLILRSNI